MSKSKHFVRDTLDIDELLQRVQIEPLEVVDNAAVDDVPLSELLQRARNILRSERAKPRDIALAWTRLGAFERGEEFGGNQKSYRAIHDAHKWILAQGFVLMRV